MRASLRRLVRAAFLQSVVAAPLAVAAALYAQEPPVVPAQPPVLPETEVEATQPATASIEDDGLTGTILDGTIFDTPLVPGYWSPSNTVGGIIDIPEIRFPGTANVVPRDVILDQQNLRFDDILRNIPAAVVSPSPQFPDRFLLRGYEVQARDFRKDGFLDPTPTPRDFQNIEQVQVLKGPASILYGGMSPAGTVNLITKKPLYDRFADGSFTFGSFQQERYMVDANGMNESGTLLYRVNGAYENTSSFRDFNFNNRGIIAPTVTWLMNDASAVTISFESHTDHRRPDHGLYVPPGGDPFALPRDVYLGEPGNDFAHYQDNRVSVMMSNQLTDTWTFNIGATGLFYGLNASQTAAVDGFPALRSRDDIELHEQANSLIANLAGDFYTGGIKHTLLLGTEQVYFNSGSDLSQSALINPFQPFDPFNPTYGVPPLAVLPVSNISVPLYDQVRNGFYVQDLMEIGERWYVLGGVRYDHLHLNFDRSLFGAPLPPIEQDFNRFSPRGGIVYQAIPDVLSYYFSYSRSFQPPNGLLNFTGEPVLPEHGELYEAGIKTELLEGLSLYACGFHTVRNNVGFTALTPLGVQFFQDGEERAQGAEVNLVGSITDYWSVIANYAYTDTRLSDPNNVVLGDGVQQRNTPYNSGNIWTRYNLIDDGDRVVGFALGVVAIGERGADLQRSVLLPGYGRVDGGLFYTRGSFYASLYAENLFDQRYIASSFDESTNGFLPGINVTPGAPINARFNVGFVY